jgi:hypothetical protein
MKKYLFLMTALLLAAASAKAADMISVRPVSIAPNSAAALAVMADFESDNIVTFQFVLELPEGVTADLDGAKLGFTGTTHTLASNKVSETTYTFLASDAAHNSAVPADNYVLAIIPLNGASTLTAGQSLDAQLSEVKVANNVNGSFVSNTLSDVTFKIETSNATLLSENDIVAPVATATAVPLKVMRTIKKDEWSTICLPFDMAADDWKAAFGSDAEIRRFSGYEKSDDGINVKFGAPLTGKFVACRPYVIKTSQDIASFTVTAQIVEKATKDEKLNEDEDETIAYMEGTLKAGTIVPEKNVFLSGNKFWYSDGTSSVMKAFRAYFWFKDEVSSDARIVMDLGETTGINDQLRMQNEDSATAPVYDLNGRKIENRKFQNRQSPRGVYIVNSKKVIIK